MKSLWSDADAETAVKRYGETGVPRELALRVYTTRLLGGEPRLVLHGGGNTSVKTTARDTLGDEVPVLCVKGSGWDMGNIEPPGLPAVRLEPLKKLLKLDSLSDEDMVNVQRCNLLDSAAPNPSVETLLHAFVPHKFVDHTHADAVLALTDQPNGPEICAEVYDGRMALVPYIMPGFGLAKAVHEIYAQNPKVEGLILLKHGIFTFGEDAREAYERMIAHVTRAEERLARAQRSVFPGVRLPNDIAAPHAVAPILRGLAAPAPGGDRTAAKRLIVEFRTSPEIRAFVDGADVADYSSRGPVTPDHVIRTKPKPVVAPAPHASDLDAFKQGAQAAFERFAKDYEAYFARNNPRAAPPRTQLDPIPRVVLVPGVGIFALGKSSKDAKIAGDLAETTVNVITRAEQLGRFESISEADAFDVEYWSLEQAKLGKEQEKRLARHIAVVTGGASGIGRATAAAFKREGAEVALLDRDGEAVKKAAREIGALPVQCDVTDTASVRAAFDAVVTAFGGLDIVVSNAGAAWSGRIGEVDEKILRESFELNFFAHQKIAQAAVAVMRAQNLGGVLLFNASKQALNPGPDFGPYGLPKSATLSLMRQYAIDYGAEGIRANAVNADRIRTGLLTDLMIAERSKARNVSEKGYMSGNLLQREVTAGDVADAFVELALARATTGAIVTVDGGNIAAAVR